MKSALLILLLMLISPVSNAQMPANQPGVEVVKFSWSKERLNWEQNPFGGPNENFHEMQFRSRSEKRVSDAKRSGTSAEVSKAEKEAKTDAAIVQGERQRKGPPRYSFLYRISIKNTGPKTITEIDWDYIFFDAGTGEALGRRQFTSVDTIGPDKSKELSFMLSTPPTQRISIYALNKKERQRLTEQVIILRVQYSDGSVWQLP